MKTSLVCLILCIAALIFGKRQQSRIAELEQRIAATEIPFRSVRPSPDNAAADYRSKYRQREASLSAPEVFETVLSLVDRKRSVSSGPRVVMENREAFQAMLKLDLAGQKELIRLIATSNDPRLGSGRHTLHKCEQINVCLCAMADKHPEVALEYLRNCDEKIGEFYRESMGPESMIEYAIRRISENDPVAGLDQLVLEVNKPKESGMEHSMTVTLISIAEREPDLVLQTIGRLPEAMQTDPLRRILEKTDSDEECSRRFQNLRSSLKDDPGAMETAFATLLRNVSKRNHSWRKSAAWFEGLNLSNEEKLLASKGLRGLGERGVDGHPEPTQWLADYLPPSKERSFILWQNVRHGIWRHMDPQAAEAFLRKNSIDEEEMKRLESEGFLRPY
jgi:hypothetical protein